MNDHQGRPRGSSFTKKEWVRFYKHLMAVGLICCAYCHEWTPDLGFGHLYLHSLGGETKPYNLTITCQKCEAIIGTEDYTGILPSLLEDMQLNYSDMYIRYMMSTINNKNNTEYIHPDGL